MKPVLFAFVLNKPNGRIAYNFHARDLHLVMGPVTIATPVEFRIILAGNLGVLLTELMLMNKVKAQLHSSGFIS